MTSEPSNDRTNTHVRALVRGVGFAFFVWSLLVPLSAPAGADSASDPVAASAQSEPLHGPQSFGGSPDFSNVPTPDGAVAIASRNGTGIAIATATGGVTTAGSVPHQGDATSLLLSSPIVDIAISASGNGYWLVAADGGVFTFGDAGYAGSVPEVLPPGASLNQPITTMVPTPTGRGYWLFASDGGVFAFGDADFLGSLPQILGPGVQLSGSIVAAAASNDGAGYWLVGADGGVFTFGPIAFHGSASPEGRTDIVDIAASNNGYHLLASDGTVRSYGTAHHGSLQSPATSLTAAPNGYWILPARLAPAEAGDSGANVAALQDKLTSLGYWLGETDGSYGHATSQAVMAFQKWEGLPASGKADQATITRLATAARPTPASTEGDLIEVDIARQLMYVVRGGQASIILNTSTGSEIPYQSGDRWFHAKTPKGRYDIYFERPNGWRVSHLGRLWRPKYFNGGIAIHGSGYIPNYPDSHGCVRLSIAAMDYFYSANLAPVGSQVWVY